jgi:hypothetical protein
MPSAPNTTENHQMKHTITITLTFETDATRESVIEGIRATLQEFEDNEVFGNCYLSDNEYDDLWIKSFEVK